MARKDKSNDLAGQRESLGAVHPLEDEEAHSARLTVVEIAERWRVRNDRKHSRRRTALAVALDMLGEVDAEGKPELKEQARKSVQAYASTKNAATRFKPETEPEQD